MLKNLFLLLCTFFLSYDEEPQYVRDATKIAAEYKIDIWVMNDSSIWYCAMAEIDLNRITFNKGHGFWEGYKENQVKEYNIHHFSSPHPDHMIRHEIGHILLGRKLGAEKFREVQCRFFPLELAYVKEKVSNYSITDLTEFYAEVFAGIWDKKIYPKDIMDLYHSIEEGREN